jgi:transposase InsO family protein
MGIREVLSAPRSPWQRAYIERLIGTLRRECLDHVIVFNEASLYRHVKSFLAYYHESRMHLSLAKDTQPSLPYRRLAVFTTGTSGAQPEFRKAPS